jgi:hypothetical protein
MHCLWPSFPLSLFLLSSLLTPLTFSICLLRSSSSLPFLFFLPACLPCPSFGVPFLSLTFHTFPSLFPYLSFQQTCLPCLSWPLPSCRPCLSLSLPQFYSSFQPSWLCSPLWPFFLIFQRSLSDFLPSIFFLSVFLLIFRLPSVHPAFIFFLLPFSLIFSYLYSIVFYIKYAFSIIPSLLFSHLLFSFSFWAGIFIYGG